MTNDENNIINEDQYVLVTDGKENYTSVYDFSDTPTLENNDEHTEEDFIDEPIIEDNIEDDENNSHLLIVLNKETGLIAQSFSLSGLTMDNDYMTVKHFEDGQEATYEINIMDHQGFIIVPKDDYINLNNIYFGEELNLEYIEKDVSSSFIKDNRKSTQVEVDQLKKELEDANKELLDNKKELIETQNRLINSEKASAKLMDSVKQSEYMYANMSMQMIDMQMILNSMSESISKTLTNYKK